MIPCQLTFNYLGVLLDIRMIRVPHIKNIATKGFRAIKIMHVISRVTWGAFPSLLLTVYKWLIGLVLSG